MHFNIKENSFLASLAARKLKSKSAAIVFGHTIHLHNISRQQFLNDERLMNHELCHVKQYQENGFLGFLFKYLLESVRHGYTNNRFEVEAREAELQIKKIPMTNAKSKSLGDRDSKIHS